MPEPENQNPRYMITYKQGFNVFDVIKSLQANQAEIYLHNTNNRQIGARIPNHMLGLVREASWLEKIIAD